MIHTLKDEHPYIYSILVQMCGRTPERKKKKQRRREREGGGKNFNGVKKGSEPINCRGGLRDSKSLRIKKKLGINDVPEKMRG